MLTPAELYGPWPVEGYVVRIDFEDGVRLVAEREGQRLASLPAAVRASGEMAWIRLAKEAAEQHQRQLKALLENAMVEGIPFTAEDLATLALDPLGRSLMGRILFERDRVVGVPVPDDWLMLTLEGHLLPLESPLKVVHPVLLRSMGRLDGWNAWLNRAPFTQPIKQLRRELYGISPRDRETPGCTARLAGEQVRWDQSRALLEGRGWYRVTKTGAERQFRSARLTAFLEFRTPAARGFSKEDVVLGRLYFLPAGERVVNRARPGLPLERVPAVVLSEALRDASLVAQVAGTIRET
ncbi:MAG: DUF4132 domain-containing protein [Armatimonadota bacterium]